MLCTELFVGGGSNMKIEGVLVVSLIGTVMVDFGQKCCGLKADVLSHSYFPLVLFY